MSLPARACRLSLAGLLLGCGPEVEERPRGDEARRYAEAFCGGLEACDCYDRFGSYEACVADREARFTGYVEQGLTLDLDCFRSVVDTEILNDCATEVVGPLEWRCDVLRGRKRRGEPCVDHHLALAPFTPNECDEGMWCQQGVCIDMDTSITDLKLGDPCAPEDEFSCVDEELRCTEAGVCEPHREEGQSCTSPLGCAMDVSADGSVLICKGYESEDGGVCTRQVDLGAACDPRDWQPCTFGLTEQGSWCDPATNTCVAGGPGVCLFGDDYRARPGA